MLEYTSRQVTQLLRQYEMFLKSLNILSSDLDKNKIFSQMTKIEEKILEETNSIYEEEYMLLLGSSTYLINEEKERLLCLVKLIEDRIKYIKERRNKHNQITGYLVDYPMVLGEDKLGEFKRNIRIIDKFNENKKKENYLSVEINELDSNISEAVKKIKNNKILNTNLEKKMISLLTKVFEKLELYDLADEKEHIEEEFKELEFSLMKAKENVKRAKSDGKEDLVIECDSLLSSITLEYEKVKEKKYTLRLMEIYDNVISDYEQLLSKREEMDNVLNEISSSYLYSLIGEELNKQYNTIKIEKQDMNTYETLVSEREKKYNELESVVEENNSKEFREVLDELLINEKKKQEEMLQKQRKKEYEERQRKLIEEKKLEDERRKRQQLIIEERKKEQESRTKQLLEQQRKTVIIPKAPVVEEKIVVEEEEFIEEKKPVVEEINLFNEVSKEMEKPKFESFNSIVSDNSIESDDIVSYSSLSSNVPEDNVDYNLSFNSVLETDSIPIIKNNKLTPEKIGIDSAIKVEEEVDEFDLFPEQDFIFPTLMDEKE